MATNGVISTYDLTVGVKLDVENLIRLISPYEVPLQGTMGSDGRTAISSETIFEVKHEWLDEALRTPRSTLASAATTGDAFIVLATGTATNFETNDVLLLDSEYMLVTGYGTTTDSLTVTRAFSGTAASHASSDLVVGVGTAPVEGADAPAGVAIDRLDRYNLTQIWGPRTVQVSGTEQSIQKYGLRGTEFDHQVANRVKEVFIAREQALLYGIRTSNTGNKQRTMGGLAFYITTNVDTVSTQLSDTTLQNNLQACFDNGGLADRVVIGSKQKRNFSNFDSTLIRYVQETNVRGQKVDYYESDFGRQLVVLDRWVRPQDAFIFSRDQAAQTTLRPTQLEMLAKTGDSVKGMVIGESGFKFYRQSWAAWMTALT
jgi:hypothetical protein